MSWVRHSASLHEMFAFEQCHIPSHGRHDDDIRARCRIPKPDRCWRQCYRCRSVASNIAIAALRASNWPGYAPLRRGSNVAGRHRAFALEHGTEAAGRISVRYRSYSIRKIYFAMVPASLRGGARRGRHWPKAGLYKKNQGLRPDRSGIVSWAPWRG